MAKWSKSRKTTKMTYPADLNETPPNPWDIVVRVTHWGIAAAVLLNGLVTEDGSGPHIWIGWAALAALIVRVFWGFVGPKPARFGAFLPDPKAAVAHLFDMLRGRPREYASHNPAGAMMVYALWGALLVVILTGLQMTDWKTPMSIANDRAAVAAGDWSVLASDDHAADHDDHNDGLAKELHEFAANLMLLLALLHVAGVVVESHLLRRNLVQAMLWKSNR